MYQFDYIKNRINLCIISSSLGNKQFCGGLLENFWKLIFLEIFDTCLDSSVRVQVDLHIQVEPYLHSGMGQVSFCQEALKNFFEGGCVKSIKRYLTHGFFVFVVRFLYQKWLIHLILNDKNIFDPRKWVIFVGKPYYKDNKPMGQVSFYRFKLTPLELF